MKPYSQAHLSQTQRWFRGIARGEIDHAINQEKKQVLRKKVKKTWSRPCYQLRKSKFQEKSKKPRSQPQYRPRKKASFKKKITNHDFDHAINQE